MILALVLTLAHGTQPAQPPVPPAAITERVHDGVFEPGDFAWMRGRFADAPPNARQEWQTIEGWQRACKAVGAARARADLNALGVTPPETASLGSGDAVCEGVAMAKSAVNGIDRWERLNAAQREARPYVMTFLYATKLAEESSIVGVDAPLGMQLLSLTVREQMLRKASGWSATGRNPAPEIREDAAMVVRASLWSATVARDVKNTRWLKAIVDEHGWPSISMVGEHSSQKAWLLVQHADGDPAFQLRALRLMEPLVTTGDVSKRNYAYLYDRVMLKTAGTQRYGTQVTCAGTERVFRPLEDGIDLDAERAKMNLEPAAEYMAMFADLPPCR